MLAQEPWMNRDDSRKKGGKAVENQRISEARKNAIDWDEQITRLKDIFDECS